MDGLEPRVARLESWAERTDQRMGALEERLGRVEDRRHQDIQELRSEIANRDQTTAEALQEIRVALSDVTKRALRAWPPDAAVLFGLLSSAVAGLLVWGLGLLGRH